MRIFPQASPPGRPEIKLIAIAFVREGEIGQFPEGIARQRS